MRNTITPDYNKVAAWATYETILRNRLWGKHTSFCSTMIIRGIGYRAYIISNDYSGVALNKPDNIGFVQQDSVSRSEASCLWNQISSLELVFSRYLIIRAGHTTDYYLGVPSSIGVKVCKKDRKLCIFGSAKAGVYSLSRDIIKYRQPSVYTGRGIREKQGVFIRKAGKKDKQKGKSF